MRLQIEENGLYLVFEIEADQPVWLLHMGARPMSREPKEDQKFLYTMLEVQTTGESRLEHFGLGHSGTLPGNRMNYVSHTDQVNEMGRVVEIYTKDEVTGLSGRMVYQFYTGIPVIRCRLFLKNEGSEEIGLEAVSSYVQAGLGSEEQEEISLLIPHNSWQEEIQWKETPVNQLGYHIISDSGISSKRIQIRNIGSWSSGEYLPLACLRNSSRGIMQFWQIEHNGAWNWELQERAGQLALVINGPDEINHH